MAIPKPVRGLPTTSQEWGDLLFKASPLSWKSSIVPLSRGIASSIQGSTPELENLKNEAFNLGGYAARGALNLTPFGGLGIRRVIPQAGAYEPTTDREKMVQDVAQGLYGGALMAPALGAQTAGLAAKGMTGGQLTGLGLKTVASSIPRVASTGAIIGGGAKAIGNIATGQPVGEGIPQAVGQGAQFALKTMPTMLGTSMAVQSLAGKIPSLNQLTDKTISTLKPMANQTLKQYVGSIGDVGIRRLVRAVLMETPLEALTYGVVNKQQQETLLDSIEREAVQNLIYNVGFAGVGTASDAINPIMKQSIENAVQTIKSGGITPEPAMAQAGFIAGPKAMFNAMTYKNAQKFVPVAEGPGGIPRIEVSDSTSKLALPGKILKMAQKGQNITVPMKSVLEHDALYSAYPKIADIPVDITASKANMKVPGAVALYDPNSNRIQMLVDPMAGDIRTNALHEIQHVIQDIEGFSSGAIPPKPIGSQTQQMIDDYQLAYQIRKTWEQMGGKASNWKKILADIPNIPARVVDSAKSDNSTEIGMTVKTLRDIARMENWQDYQKQLPELESRGVEVGANMTQKQLEGSDPYGRAMKYAQITKTGTVTPTDSLQANIPFPNNKQLASEMGLKSEYQLPAERMLRNSINEAEIEIENRLNEGYSEADVASMKDELNDLVRQYDLLFNKPPKANIPKPTQFPLPGSQPTREGAVPKDLVINDSRTGTSKVVQIMGQPLTPEQQSPLPQFTPDPLNPSKLHRIPSDIDTHINALKIVRDEALKANNMGEFDDANSNLNALLAYKGRTPIPKVQPR